MPTFIALLLAFLAGAATCLWIVWDHLAAPEMEDAVVRFTRVSTPADDAVLRSER